MFGALLLILLVLLMVGTLPTWPHSRSWGYKPTTGVAIVLVIALIFMVMRKNEMMGIGYSSLY